MLGMLGMLADWATRGIYGGGRVRGMPEHRVWCRCRCRGVGGACTAAAGAAKSRRRPSFTPTKASSRTSPSTHRQRPLAQQPTTTRHRPPPAGLPLASPYIASAAHLHGRRRHRPGRPTPRLQLDAFDAFDAFFALVVVFASHRLRRPQQQRRCFDQRPPPPPRYPLRPSVRRRCLYRQCRRFCAAVSKTPRRQPQQPPEPAHVPRLPGSLHGQSAC